MNKRYRRRANEIANIKTGKPWFTIAMILLGLTVIFFMRATIGDETAGIFSELVGDPDLELPRSVSDTPAKAKTNPMLIPVSHGDPTSDGKTVVIPLQRENKKVKTLTEKGEAVTDEEAVRQRPGQNR